MIVLVCTFINITVVLRDHIDTTRRHFLLQCRCIETKTHVNSTIKRSQICGYSIMSTTDPRWRGPGHFLVPFHKFHVAYPCHACQLFPLHLVHHRQRHVLNDAITGGFVLSQLTCLVSSSSSCKSKLSIRFRRAITICICLVITACNAGSPLFAL